MPPLRAAADAAIRQLSHAAAADTLLRAFRCLRLHYASFFFFFFLPLLMPPMLPDAFA